VLDFDNFGHGTLADDEYGALGVAIQAANADRDYLDNSEVDALETATDWASSGVTRPDNNPLRNWPVVYDTDVGDDGDPDLNAPYDSDNPDLADNYHPGAILIINENQYGCGDGVCNTPDDERTRFSNKSTGFFQFDFDQAVDLTSLDFFGVEGAESATDTHNQIFFLGEGMTVAGSVLHTPDTGGDNSWDRLTFSYTGVRRLIVELAGSGGIDNLAGSMNVPEPGTLALLLSGILLLSMRRRPSAPLKAS
jgi:hypothetical protein